jgi:hypothetical protein
MSCRLNADQLGYLINFEKSKVLQFFLVFPVVCGEQEKILRAHGNSTATAGAVPRAYGVPVSIFVPCESHHRMPGAPGKRLVVF